jgi:hypothetical protein
MSPSMFGITRWVIAAAAVVASLASVGQVPPSSTTKPAIPATQAPMPATLAPASSPGSVTLSRDDLSLAQTVIQIGGGLFGVFALVMGTIVGINVFNGASILKDARAELNSAKEEMLSLRKARQDYESGVTNLKADVDKLTHESILKVRAEAQNSFEIASKRLYRRSTLDDYIREILIELSKEKPSEEFLYPKVTALVGFLDEDIITVYLECFKKLPSDSELVHQILKNGFKGLQAHISLKTEA